jgi:hypothetical protein
MGFQYTVKRGDHLAKIAAQFGFRKWETIYQHGKNADFRAKRTNPNVIFAGDQIYIPDKDPKKEPGATGKRHTFQLVPRTLDLKVQIKDHHGHALAKEPYILKFGNETREGDTSPAGWLHEKIPVTMEKATLYLKRQKIRWNLHVGHLDPVMDEDTQDPVVYGVQQRLNNLGFDCGKEDGVMGPKTEWALKMFQYRIMKRPDPDGQPDTDTLEALKSGHVS